MSKRWYLLAILFLTSFAISLVGAVKKSKVNNSGPDSTFHGSLNLNPFDNLTISHISENQCIAAFNRLYSLPVECPPPVSKDGLITFPEVQARPDSKFYGDEITMKMAEVGYSKSADPSRGPVESSEASIGFILNDLVDRFCTASFCDRTYAARNKTSLYSKFVGFRRTLDFGYCSGKPLIMGRSVADKKKLSSYERVSRRQSSISFLYLFFEKYEAKLPFMLDVKEFETPQEHLDFISSVCIQIFSSLWYATYARLTIWSLTTSNIAAFLVETDELTWVFDFVADMYKDVHAIKNHNQLMSNSFISRWTSKKSDFTKNSDFDSSISLSHRSVGSGALMSRTSSMTSLSSYFHSETRSKEELILRFKVPPAASKKRIFKIFNFAVAYASELDGRKRYWSVHLSMNPFADLFMFGMYLIPHLYDNYLLIIQKLAQLGSNRRQAKREKEELHTMVQSLTDFAQALIGYNFMITDDQSVTSMFPNDIDMTKIRTEFESVIFAQTKKRITDANWLALTGEALKVSPERMSKNPLKEFLLANWITKKIFQQPNQLQIQYRLQLYRILKLGVFKKFRVDK